MPHFQYLFCCVMILMSIVSGAPAQHRQGRSFSQDYSEIEQLLIQEKQSNLANLARELRLKNPYPKGSEQYQIWWEQAQFNVPILILSSIFLDKMCRKENIKKILFSQRDCYHWIKIFKELFPDYDSRDFMTSRVAYRNPSPEYVQYVRNLCQDRCIIVDVQGTGKTCLEFFKNYFQSRPLHLAIVRSGTLCPGITHEFVYIEALNYAPFGSLMTLNSEGPVRFDVEYPVKLIEPATACVDRAVRLLKPGRFRFFNQVTMDRLMSVLKKYMPILMRYHVEDHGRIGMGN